MDCGVYVGGGWGGLHCLSFFRYSFKFGDKVLTVRFDVQVLPNFEGKMALSITGDAGIVAVNMDQKDFEESVTFANTVSWGNAGEWGNRCLFLLVSAS